MKRAIAVLLAFASAAPLGACRKALPAAAVVFGRGEDAESLDPQAIDDGESAKVVENVFDGLVTFGPGTCDVVPSLAESWTTSPDGLEWTFRLRQGVKFHDGTPFDADAVVFSMNRLLDEANPLRPDDKVPYASFYRGIVTSVTAKDPSTAVFRLSRPYAPFLANMAMFSADMVSP
jgi:peptide/nickel transport system substrate-binding protein